MSGKTCQQKMSAEKQPATPQRRQLGARKSSHLRLRRQCRLIPHLVLFVLSDTVTHPLMIGSSVPDAVDGTISHVDQRTQMFATSALTEACFLKHLANCVWRVSRLSSDVTVKKSN